MIDRLQLRSVWWPRLVMAAAGFFLLWTAVRTVWLVLAGPMLPQPDPNSELPVPKASARAESIPLSRWHLFGQAEQGINLAALAASAPETALRLFLKGTMNLEAPEGGLAIIADEQGDEAAYRVGDALPGNAELIGIYAGRVLLRRAGIEEGLSLLGEAPPSGSAPRAAASVSSNGQGRTTRPIKPLDASVPAFVNPQISVGTPVMDAIRGTGRVDVAELAKQVNVIPVMENNRFAGVRLSVGRDSDLLARSGLRSSDVITAVNGIPLDGVQRQAELLNVLRNDTQFTVTIRRDGQTMDVPVGL